MSIIVEAFGYIHNVERDQTSRLVFGMIQHLLIISKQKFLVTGTVVEIPNPQVDL